MNKDTQPLIQKAQEFKPAPISHVFRYATAGDYLLCTIGMVATLCHAVLPGFLALNIGRIFDQMEETDNVDLFYDAEVQIAFLLFGLGIFALCIGIIAVSSFIKVGTNQSLAFRHNYFKALVNKSISYYDEHNAAQMSTAVDSECTTIEQAAGEKIMVFFDAIFMFINSWAIAVAISAQLALIALVQLPIQIIAGKIIEGSGMKAVLRLQQAYKAASGVSEEALYEVKTVAAYNAQDRVAREYQEKLRPCMRMQTKDGFTFGIGWSLYYSVLFVFQGVLFYVGALLLEEDQENWVTGVAISPGYVLTVFFAVAVSSHQLSNALPALTYMTRARTSVATMIPIIDEPVYRGGALSAEGINGLIQFENIAFAYPKNPTANILQGFNLEIEAGTSVAIVGETGAGKSTIINMIQQFYEPTLGRIKVDGVDITSYDLFSLRSQMALVSQEPILFNMTVRQNILVGKQSATDVEVIQAAKNAGIHAFIAALPQGYSTLVGPKGSQLSGGQKQRIAIARAIIRNPRILLLDEATSALDTKTEQAIQRTLNSLMHGRTTVIVAQRLSTVRGANKICVLKDGVVHESGSHDELVEADGIYANLYRMQGGGDAASELAIAKVEEAEPVAATPPPVAPTPKAEESGGSLFMRVMRLLSAYWYWLLLAILAAVLSGAMFPTFGYFFAVNTVIIIDTFNPLPSEGTAGNIIYLCVLAVLVIIGLTFLTGSLTRVTALFTFDMRYHGLRSFLYFDNAFFDDPANHPAVLSGRLSTDCARVNAIGGPVIGVQILAVAAIVIALAISTQYSISLGLLVAICLPLIFIGQKNGRLAQIRGFANVSHEQAVTTASDTMLNLRTVHAFNYQENCVQRYYQAAEIVASDAKRQSYRSGFYFGYIILILYFTYGAASWYGAYLVKYDGLSYAAMTISFFSVMFATWAFTIVGALSPDIQGGVQAAKNLFRLVDYKPTIDASSDNGLKTPLHGKVSFVNVSFAYPAREVQVLKSLNFVLEPGQSIGVAGSTGSGKSTITQLLLRFYDISMGRILLDDRDIALYNLKHLRQEIGWVGQEPTLFSGTLEHNLRLGNPDATEEELVRACDQAQALEFISKGDDFLKRDVGLRGQKLSGGQKQRIGIARALVKRPKILILDEATSALDSSTERKVQVEIEQLNISCISIAHRLSTIQHCDQILVIELGEVVERGSHDELMAQGGAYFNMLNTSA